MVNWKPRAMTPHLEDRKWMKIPKNTHKDPIDAHEKTRIYLGHPLNHQRPCFWYLKTSFFGGGNLCFSWFWVLLVDRHGLGSHFSRLFLLLHHVFCPLLGSSEPACIRCMFRPGSIIRHMTSARPRQAE